MTGLTIPTGPRPGLRAGVLTVSALLVVGTAFAVSANVSDHLAEAAIHEAVRATQAVVLDDMETAVTPAVMGDPSGPGASAVDAQLKQLVSAGQILRIKIWSPDGTVVFSDLPALRGRQFPIDEDLSAALAGNIGTDISDASDVENVFERGLADRFLSVYLPMRSS